MKSRELRERRGAEEQESKGAGGEGNYNEFRK
jgi:hypothetical protein